ncbi:MAG: CRISPR-associated protein Cas5 [Bacillota bacterium]|jgi:CRISPR-associated protein Cas5d
MLKEYPVCLEISGPAAMWTRPDTGDSPVSYPAPTYSAVRGIFESILWSEWAMVVPTKVEICSPITFHQYTTNYGGPLRKSKVITGGGSYQLAATILVNVCYRLYARAEPYLAGYAKHGRPGLQSVGTTNGAHAYMEVFNRRIRRGQCYRVPCLGWSEFLPDYVGAFRAGTSVSDDINLTIPSMLRTCFAGHGSSWDPKYDVDVRIEKGVLRFAE